MTRTRLSIGDLHLSVTASGAGRPFLFIHGLCGDSGQTTELLPQVAGWGGICPDCRGHGDSDFGDIASLSIAQFTADMIALSRTLDGPSPVIGGISMGAAIALRAAVTHPDSFSGLVLARPTSPGRHRTIWTPFSGSSRDSRPGRHRRFWRRSRMTDRG